jgi:hypothetical protein
LFRKEYLHYQLEILVLVLVPELEQVQELLEVQLQW